VFKQACFLLVLAMPGVRIASAQMPAQSVQDIQAMAKWITAQVVHYHIEAVHQGWTQVVDDQSSQGDVTDRLILDFDYKLQEHKFVGPARFQNVKTITKALGNSSPPCLAPILKGDFEYLDVKEVVLSGGDSQVIVKGTRSFPAGQAATQCPINTALNPVAAKQVPAEARLSLQLPVVLFMGAASTSDIKIAPDKKSFAQTAPPWVWTVTPTIVQ
jgi:hypothetical protein